MPHRPLYQGKEVELQKRYPQVIVDKVLRIGEMYNWFISNHDGTAREFVTELCQRHDISKATIHIEDVQFEDVDLELDVLFPNMSENNAQNSDEYSE